jgi:integrase
MATVKAFIRKSKKDLVKIRFRLIDGRDISLYYVSDIIIKQEYWDNTKEQLKSRILIDNVERIKINTKIEYIKNTIFKAYSLMIEQKEDLDSKVLTLFINNALNPNNNNEDKNNSYSLIILFNHFINTKDFIYNRKMFFLRVSRLLNRYEKYITITTHKKYVLNVRKIDSEKLRDIEKFIMSEPKIIKQYPEIYEEEKYYVNSQKSYNTLNKIMRGIREFFIWCINNNYISKSPFENYEMPQAIYGTPYYITIEERNKIYYFDTTTIKTAKYKDERLEISKDMFVLQCCIGCRVKDMLDLKQKNVINGAIEYIANKTKKENARTIRVPLNKIAQEIINKYKQEDKEAPLLPFCVEQRYNQNIKTLFRFAGIDRVVTIFNSTTKQQEQKPLYEIASSHLARRTFIGNLYKQVKDPNLIGALSGHVEGSKAFARYRTIDEDMKKDLVKLLE